MKVLQIRATEEWIWQFLIFYQDFTQLSTNDREALEVVTATSHLQKVLPHSSGGQTFIQVSTEKKNFGGGSGGRDSYRWFRSSCTRSQHTLFVLVLLFSPINFFMFICLVFRAFLTYIYQGYPFLWRSKLAVICRSEELNLQHIKEQSHLFSLENWF